MIVYKYIRDILGIILDVSGWSFKLCLGRDDLRVELTGTYKILN